ncbi:MAG: IS1 family transposase [Planctomycetes bacterium]|nr:IS1 family transposase [Planctomycetota bacterium]
MANHLKRDRQIAVLRLLVEGNSIRSTERLTGVTKRAILRLLVRFGDSCQDLMKERFCDLSLRHVQVDEMHTFVGTRQVNLRVDQKDDPNIGEQYLWYGIDQDTKLVPTFLVGKRSADNARRLMVDLRSRLAIPTPGEADRRGGYKPIIKISTDGLAAYPEAVDLAFGPYAEYGQLIKNYRNANMPGKYSPGELTGADRRPVFGDMNPWTICTSHIERANLTVRTFVRRFTRLSLGFSKKLENLKAACAVNFAFYNFCWRPRTTRITPAMAAGVVKTLWNMDDLYDAAMGA